MNYNYKEMFFPIFTQSLFSKKKKSTRYQDYLYFDTLDCKSLNTIMDNKIQPKKIRCYKKDGNKYCIMYIKIRKYDSQLFEDVVMKKIINDIMICDNIEQYFNFIVEFEESFLNLLKSGKM